MKVIKISRVDARIDMLRCDMSSFVLLMMAVICLVLQEIYPMEPSFIVYGIIIFLLLMAVAFIGISALARNDIQALNIIGWPGKKYEEIKDE